MLRNPRVQRNGLLLVGAAVVGPALAVAGVKYPGSIEAKIALTLMGLAVTGTTYYYLSSDMQALLLEEK